MITEEEKEKEENKFDSNDDSTDSERMSDSICPQRQVFKKAINKSKKLNFNSPHKKVFKVLRLNDPNKKKDKEMTTLIEKISGLAVTERTDSNNDVSSENDQTTLIFFLTETFEHNFDALCREVKKCFISPFDLKKIEVYVSNHQRIMIARIYHNIKNLTSLKNSKSSLFTTEFGGELYSRSLKGTFKVFSDIC